MAEAVTIKVGSFTTTIPPDSFVMTSPGNYAFNGVVDSVALKVSVDLKSGETYAFQATAGVNLLGTKSPTNVTLTIGNDTGATTVRF